jgi:hypothetical protein
MAQGLLPLFRVKNFLLAACMVGAGAWYVHHAFNYRRTPEPEQEKPRGEIVIAEAPDGSLQRRWQSPTPVPANSR